VTAAFNRKMQSAGKSPHAPASAHEGWGALLGPRETVGAAFERHVRACRSADPDARGGREATAADLLPLVSENLPVYLMLLVNEWLRLDQRAPASGAATAQGAS